MDWVAITGGATDIGKAVVQAVQAAGWQAASLDDQANPAADLSLVLDLQDEAALAAAMAKIGPLRGLACIAGANTSERIEDLSWDDWCRVMQTNAAGPMLVMKHAQMAKGGAIVLTVSVLPGHITDKSSAFHSSHGAVLGLMRASCAEFALQGVRVNAVSQGARNAVAELPSNDGHAPTDTRSTPAQRLAEAILFLLSDSASFITGEELIVSES